MADTQPPRVDHEIVQMWRRDGRLYAIAGFIAGVMLFPLLASLSANLTGFLQELAPEAIGILITVFLIDRIIQRRDERNTEAALKRQLLIDVKSSSNEIAKNAVHQLRSNGWLMGEDGLLKGANLFLANLDGARLINANLDGASLILANLNGAHLYGANLNDAGLNQVNLHGAGLSHTHLNGTSLIHANLDSADLKWANLDGADLLGASLQNANFVNATFSEKTALPDETFWTPETDMTRFTDPNHPNFWRSDDPRSPAYRGDPES